MTASVFSTLNGKLAGKHPELGVLVRDDGKVLCLNKGNRWGSPNAKFHWAVGTLDPNGYKCIRIKQKLYHVHRLVAETFIPNPEGKPTVDHVNRNRADNRLSNLRWATFSEQIDNSSRVIDALDLGVRKHDDPKEWRKQFRRLKRQDPEWVEKMRTYKRKYYAKKKAEQSAQPS